MATTAVNIIRRGFPASQVDPPVFLDFLRTISHHCRDRVFLLGFYCPADSSSTPVPCPEGTYGPTADAVSIDNCLMCPPHHYCPRPGLSAILPCGPEAEQPLPGRDTCICPGEGQHFQVAPCFLCYCSKALTLNQNFIIQRKNFKKSYELPHLSETLD